jgi:hypothetical protein
MKIIFHLYENGVHIWGINTSLRNASENGLEAHHIYWKKFLNHWLHELYGVDHLQESGILNEHLWTEEDCKIFKLLTFHVVQIFWHPHELPMGSHKRCLCIWSANMWGAVTANIKYFPFQLKILLEYLSMFISPGPDKLVACSLKRIKFDIFFIRICTAVLPVFSLVCCSLADV